ncbi:ribonuclease H-like domain-containing protein [Luteimonas sp. RD2P54]|uniref:Ribonuclease H-like domain-containing protein n=1 Tax=Luteimonas endophytica TaxID=3042023 RepID=A0ABT6J9J7_9GAMM|nr:ribonuclease H-like domain-containing protein [Luteimonas endophytica]MDH5822868.1 ribonuclease H-like domain-containing protein [Luteimonas endophytica]
MTQLARRLAGLRREAGAAGESAARARPVAPDGRGAARSEPPVPAAPTGVAVVDRLPDCRAAANAAARDPGAVDAELGDAAGGARDAAIARLRRLLDLQPRPAPRPAPAADRALNGEEIAPGLRYVETWAPWEAHGPLSLYGIGQGEVAREHLLAFDTETTGLAGGTGTRAFMIGAADFRDGGLRLRQLCIATLAAEAEMLRIFAGWLGPDTVLLSYNGKSYDRPLLSTRFRLARQPDPLPGCGHIDLLHPMRRRYRGVWPNCRLATAERELLGVVREDDLPGAEAPAAWLGYLRGGSAAKLRRVGAHNAQDLRSLCALLERLTDRDPPAPGAWTAPRGGALQPGTARPL